MTATTTEDEPALAAVEPAGSSGYDERVAALTAAHHRTVDHIMTTRYRPDWATRGDLPDEAYTTETTFPQWLNDLLDHIVRPPRRGRRRRELTSRFDL
ncbi:MAG: hypothetical protein QOE76_2494 [Frankiales bacterium]|jgi:hypothetical protein|nr:hypothetical protein [Frankiales bacterium]